MNLFYSPIYLQPVARESVTFHQICKGHGTILIFIPISGTTLRGFKLHGHFNGTALHDLICNLKKLQKP
jgi:hypothetical protein